MTAAPSSPDNMGDAPAASRETRTAPSRGLPVFFSGGTALRGLASFMARSKLRAVHLVTTFDSGGSTASLRKAFNMPAPGDLRNRLVALADEKACGKALVSCMNERFPESGDADDLRERLKGLANAQHPYWQGLNEPQAESLRLCLTTFLKEMPRDFDARTASLGNLFMAGKYLQERRSLNAVMGFFSRLLHVQGEVLPIMEESLHLAAALENGEVLVGQHLFKDLPAPIAECFLTVSEPGRVKAPVERCRPRASSAALARLREAGLVCYPMGSFYSSLVANLLADGVATVIGQSKAPKVFIPNTGIDRELVGKTLAGELQQLLATLRGMDPGANGRFPADHVSHVLVDSVHGRYPGGIEDMQALAENLGVQVVHADMVTEDGLRHDPERTCAALFAIEDTHAVRG